MLKSLYKKIEHVFEHDYVRDQFSFLQEQPDKNFTVEDRSELMLNLTLCNSKESDWHILFSQLSAYFEFGLLFENTNLKKSFYYGKNFDCASAKLNLQLPKSEIFAIYKTPTLPFLKKMKLNFIPEQNKLSCFVVRVDTYTHFVLFSTKAQPWLKIQMENLQKLVMNYSVLNNENI